MYLDELASRIATHIPKGRLPDGDAQALLRLYAMLLRAKGIKVSQSDVHDAWSAWIASRNTSHESLVAYEDLPAAVQEQDAVFATAIRRAAEQVSRVKPSQPELAEVLFPQGPPRDQAAVQQAFDLYKMMVQSSEALVSRRQGVNTFFLTMNGAILTAFGLIVQNSAGHRIAAGAIAVLALAGAILCAAWRSLIISFGQLNRGKFVVINAIERYLAAAIYAGEWEALGRGENPRVYRSFTSREIWVPNALLVLHGAATLVGGAIAAGWITLKP